MKRLIAPVLLVAAVGITLAVTAGGGRDTGGAAAPGPPCRTWRSRAWTESGDFALTQLTRAEKPTLLWFWAPWCEV